MIPDYKTMYFQLAAKVADAIELLSEAQQRGEESYISDENQPAIKIASLENRDKEKMPSD